MLTAGVPSREAEGLGTSMGLPSYPPGSAGVLLAQLPLGLFAALTYNDFNEPVKEDCCVVLQADCSSWTMASLSNPKKHRLVMMRASAATACHHWAL